MSKKETRLENIELLCIKTSRELTETSRKVTEISETVARIEQELAGHRKTEHGELEAKVDRILDHLGLH